MKIFKKPIVLITMGIMLAVVTTILATACTSDEDISPCPDEQDGTAYTELINDLDDFCLQFSQDHPNNSRGDLGWSKFKESLKADHVGYSNGSWVGSIGASRKKWKELKAEEELKKELLENNAQQREEEGENEGTIPPMQLQQLTNQRDSLISVFRTDKTNIGAIHNASIIQSYLEGDTDFKTTEDLVISVLISLESLGLDISQINKSEVVNEIDHFFDQIYDEDISVMYDRLSKEYPDRKDEFTIQCQYLSTMNELTTLEEILAFSNGFIDIVNGSNLTKTKKDEVKSNLSVAPSSYQLWRTIDSLPD